MSTLLLVVHSLHAPTPFTRSLLLPSATASCETKQSMHLQSCCSPLPRPHLHPCGFDVSQPLPFPLCRYFVREQQETQVSQVELFLNSVPILAPLSRDERLRLVDALEEITFTEGTKV